MMQEEFGSLYSAIAIAVFLVFVVMASQFESVKIFGDGHDDDSVQPCRFLRFPEDNGRHNQYDNPCSVS